MQKGTKWYFRKNVHINCFLEQINFNAETIMEVFLPK